MATENTNKDCHNMNEKFESSAQPIPLVFLEDYGCSSEEDFLNKEPKKYSVLKKFFNLTQQEQKVMLKIGGERSSEDERVKNLIKDVPYQDIKFIAGEMVKNNRSIDGLFTMGADEFCNLEE